MVISHLLNRCLGVRLRLINITNLRSEEQSCVGCFNIRVNRPIIKLRGKKMICVCTPCSNCFVLHAYNSLKNSNIEKTLRTNTDYILNFKFDHR